MLRIPFPGLGRSGRIAAPACLLLLLAAHLVVGDARPGSPAPTPEHAPGLMEIDEEVLSPRLRQIREVLAREQAELATLQVAFREETNPQNARAIAARIREIKTSTEVAVLEIQLEYARAQGEIERAATVEAMLEQHANTGVPPEGKKAERRSREEER